MITVKQIEEHDAAKPKVEILEPSAPYPPPSDLQPGRCCCVAQDEPNFHCPVHGR